MRERRHANCKNTESGTQASPFKEVLKVDLTDAAD